jgi:putative glutamine amidotransferase
MQFNTRRCPNNRRKRAAMIQQKRPTIGVVGALFERKGAAPISGIGRTYLEAIEAGGGIPLLIHLTDDQAVFDAHYRLCDGLLFCGGGDIAPKHYGHPPHRLLGPVEELRDEIELTLARRAVADHKPVLAICRGIQLINVALGGTLYQDISDELPGTLDHRASSKSGDRAYLAHTLELDSASWLAEQLGTTTIAVNTLHHQALRDVAPGLRVVGCAPDGIIEAVEGTGDTFIVGVQCHPEELWRSAETRWARLFTGFIAHVAA